MMEKRRIRCGIVDLSDRTAAVQELEAEVLTRAETLQKAVLPLLGDHPSAVLLYTGVLTGCGAPGTGAMIWYTMEGDRITPCFSEGRLGATLRCAGLDALVITGAGSEPAVIAVRDQAVTVEPLGAGRADLEAAYGDEHGTIATVREDGLWEDGYCRIADQRTAGALLDRNVAAVSAVGYGYVALADGEALGRCSAELWQACRRSADQGRRAVSRVRYLSAGDVLAEAETAVYGELLGDSERSQAFLAGIFWPEALPEEELGTKIPALISAVTGRSTSWEQLLGMERNEEGKEVQM